MIDTNTYLVSLDDSTITVTASLVSQAGVVAVQKWYERGRWSGESLPNAITVTVKNVLTGETFVVDVEPVYSVDFYCTEAKRA